MSPGRRFQISDEAEAYLDRMADDDPARCEVLVSISSQIAAHVRRGDFDAFYRGRLFRVNGRTLLGAADYWISILAYMGDVKILDYFPAQELGDWVAYALIVG